MTSDKSRLSDGKSGRCDWGCDAGVSLSSSAAHPSTLAHVVIIVECRRGVAARIVPRPTLSSPSLRVHGGCNSHWWSTPPMCRRPRPRPRRERTTVRLALPPPPRRRPHVAIVEHGCCVSHWWRGHPATALSSSSEVHGG